MHTNSFSKFGDDFPIAGLSVKQFIELCVSLGFGNRPNSYPNKPESPPPEIMGINDVIKLTDYSTLISTPCLSGVNCGEVAYS